MQFVTITTAQALYAALGLSIFACIMAVVLTVMAFVHITGRWADSGISRDVGRPEEIDDVERLAKERDLYRAICGKMATELSQVKYVLDAKEGKV